MGFTVKIIPRKDILLQAINTRIEYILNKEHPIVTEQYLLQIKKEIYDLYITQGAEAANAVRIVSQQIKVPEAVVDPISSI
jgi:hypothetical protein